MIDFSLDGKNVQAVMSTYEGKKFKPWYNFHLTKHVVGDFQDEYFFQSIGLSENERKDIRNVQLNKYYCGLSKNSFSDFCRSCEYINACYDTLKNVRENYNRLIRDSLVNDGSKPRHAHTETLKRSKTIKEVIVLNNIGTSVVMIERINRYYVKTCYRLANIKKYKIREEYSIMNDDEISLEESKMMWRRRFRGTRYSYIKEHQTVNWNPIEQ